MSDPKVIVARRGHCKGSITRLKNSFSYQEYLSFSLEKVQARKERLTTAFNEYLSLCAQIAALEGADQEDPGDIEEVFVDLIAEFDAVINKIKSWKPTPEEAKPTQAVPSGSSVKLPNIVIPTFDGKHTEYYQFIDLFTALIHKDASLSPVQKLYYLKWFVSGEALSTIANLPLQDDSYTQALQLLKERFDKKPKIAQQHISALLDLPSITRSPVSINNLITETKRHLGALKNLGEPVDSWDSIIVCIITRKLDEYNKREFKMSRDRATSPKIKELLDYLERRATSLEADGERPQLQPQRLVTHAVAAQRASPAAQEAPPACLYCKSCEHKLFKCPGFFLLTPNKRVDFVSVNKVCTTCLSQHKRKCKYHFRCAECKGDHNSLLHTNDNALSSPSVTLVSASPQGQILLPTARVKIISQSGTTIYARALLDSASQASFVTQKTVDLLGFTPKNANTTIIGITNAAKTINKCVNLQVHSTVYPFKINVDCQIVKSITSRLPQVCLDMTNLTFPANYRLADASFNVPGDVDLLLGADIFFQVLLPPQPEHSRTSVDGQPPAPSTSTAANTQQPSLVHTSFGYIVAGRSNAKLGNNKKVSLFCQQCDNSLGNQLSAFWETEKVPEIFPEQLPEQEFCEKLFLETTELENNKYTVSMPIKVPLEQVNSELGESFNLALKRFLNLEKKLQKNKVLFSEYKKIIDQYVELNHGEYCDINAYNLSKDPVYFLPHHAVINENSLTTKLRVVFDGSMPTNKRVSLNDILLNGPVVQKDLFEILIAFRMEVYFFICDITKMFRCINVDPSQRSLQNILWRDSPDEDIKCIKLNTVTYGLKPSSYLATRCLIDLAIKYEDRFPRASLVLKNSTYIDDILANSSSEEVLMQIKSELVQLLALGGFQLHKWASNCSSILETVPKDKQQFGELDMQKHDMSIKTLGVSFDIKQDVLKSKCPEPSNTLPDTKRKILSYISQYHDPMGLIGPLLVRAKVIMQKLCASHIDWDSIPPKEIQEMWSEFVYSLSQMQPVSIPRCVKPRDHVVAQLIGFADASSVAYGCCLYLRSVDIQGKVHVNLLCAKSRINPLDKQLTIPRLELNAALLLAKLTRKVDNVLKTKVQINDTYLYSDSQIALAWLNTEVTKLQTYVANRVRQIVELAHDCQWGYVGTEDNPSDCLSRGLKPDEIKDNKLWWHGPSFLHERDYKFNPTSTVVVPENLPELKPKIENKAVCITTATLDVSIFERLKKFSSINKMTRILAYIVRFCNNVKSKSVRNQSKFLSTDELSKALLLIVKQEQEQFYSDDIKSLQSQRNLTGNLKSLTPFLDKYGILRVGGRLQNASIPYAQQHPAILPKGSDITALIIRDEHLRLLHAGQKLVLSSLKQRFWIIDGLRTVKKVIHKCVICFRMKAAATTQLMGSLPAERVTACRPFERVGLDFAGPVSVKNSRIRKSVIGKGYIALFVCFVTKAIHLELVSDLTTECFLACFKRFIARRNLPSDVYCDNGSTFKGARNQLDEFYRLYASQTHQSLVNAYASQRGINFHFIPAYSPIFGGLWESGVKSVKHHLKRVVGNACLTYEQLNSVLVEIEGVLNSRPLTPVTADSNDFSYLSPGHFLTGAPLNSYPERDVSSTPTNLLKFWSITVSMKQNFWKYWSKNYLNLLQNRPKWQNVKPNVNVGSLVILCTDNTPPLLWPMARITKLFPGKDGKVCAVEVRTANGHVHNRSITKVCVLPIDV